MDLYKLWKWSILLGPQNWQDYISNWCVLYLTSFIQVRSMLQVDTHLIWFSVTFSTRGLIQKDFSFCMFFFGYLLLITIGVMNDERLENFLWSITSSFSKVFPPKKSKHQKTFGTFFWHFYILSKVVCKNFYSISLILIKVYSQTPDVTANAKDSEVRYKKVYGFWFIHLKNWNTSH